MKRKGNRYLEIGFRKKLLVIFWGVVYLKGKLEKFTVLWISIMY